MESRRWRFLRKHAGTAIHRLTDPLAYLPAPRRPPTGRPVVGAVGYYGWGNYGDELFLQVFHEHLGPPIELRTVLDPRGGRIRHRGIGAVTRASDAILIGGGDIVVPWAYTSRYWEPAYLRRPVFVTGVGVPTWDKPLADGIAFLGAFFRHPSIRAIGARDETSAAWIRDRLAPRVPVTVAPDLVFALTLPPATPPSDPPIFGVVVRRRAGRDDLANVRRLCRRAETLGYRVRRIVLGTGEVRRRDLAATAELGLEDTELVATDDLAEISRAIGECTAMASMKFHGVVVATMYGVPCIVLMPTAKSRYLVDTLGRPDLLSAYSDPDLPDRVARDMAPIDPAIRASLRDGAVASLRELRRAMLDAAAGSPSGRVT